MKLIFKFVEVVHNVHGGPYLLWVLFWGVFLIEKIKRDDGRVPVARLTRDSREPAVSGGYMFKKDRLDPGDSGFSLVGLEPGMG